MEQIIIIGPSYFKADAYDEHSTTAQHFQHKKWLKHTHRDNINGAQCPAPVRKLHN